MHPLLSRWIAVMVLVLAGVGGHGIANPPAYRPVPPIVLERFDAPGEWCLTNHAGEIVVLDFFAYWCAPCRRASDSMEREIQRHYAARGGNPQGIPVRVVAVNIEKEQPEATRRFVAQTGLSRVVNDPDGSFLAALGGSGTPYVVVIDGTGAATNQPTFQVRHALAGFSGAEKLRRIIDGIGGVTPAVKERLARPGDWIQELRIDGAAAALVSSDVEIVTGTAEVRLRHGRSEGRVGYLHQEYALEYRPYETFDFLGLRDRVRESLDGVQAGWKRTLGERWVAGLAGAAYDGFTDYRSLWLATYYRQQFGFVPGYRRPEPHGFNFSGSLRWEYQPTTGFAETGFRYANDTISPGYELDQGTSTLEHGRTVLHTYAPSVAFENVVSRRVRVRNELELRVTSARRPRLGYRGSVNVALAERWVARVSGGYTHEDPVLRAWFAGAALEYEVATHWHLSVDGLTYEDTGEIENSLFISTAGPGLRSFQVGPALRYLGTRFQASLSVSPLRVDYDPVAVGTRPFANLYRDRTWIHVQAAASLRF